MPSRATTGPPAPTPPGSGASPGQVMRWIFDVVNTHRSAPLRAVLTDRSRVRTPDGTHRGADEILAYWDRVLAAVPDLTMTMQEMAEQDETVFVRWTLTGTHSGAAFGGVAPTGARLDLDGVDHATVRAGSLVSDYVIYDRAQLAQQVGLVPAEGSRLDVALRRGFNLLTRARR